MNPETKDVVAALDRIQTTLWLFVISFSHS